MTYNFEKIRGTLVYVQLQEPVKAYVKPGAPSKPDEWKASVVLTDEDYVDALEEYAKSLDTQISLKKVKTASFEEIYKTASPEDAGKNVWVLTLRKSVELGKTGKPVPDKFKPRVYLKDDGVIQDITATKLVGNGSKGSISVDKFDRAAGGSSLYLKNVLVTDLVEYEAKESDYKPGSEFEDENEPAKENKPKTAPAKKAVKPATPPDDDDFPF